MTAVSEAPFKKIDFLPRDIEVDRRADGTIVLRSRYALDPYERHLAVYLRRWAAERPNTVWLAQRRGPERAWHTITYGVARRIVDAVTQGLLARGLGPDRPVMILSGNSLEHALMTLAAMQAGVPAAPVSTAYSLLSQDHAKLKYVCDLLQPGVVFVQSGRQFAKALAALPLDNVLVVHVDDPADGIVSIPFESLAATPATPAVDAAIASLRPDTVGKYLFTSGSTGMPKAVINTQEMMCANIVMMRQVRPRAADDPPVVVLDWLPWNHTMGGNALFNSVLAEGGTLYIDDGRPLPGQFDETIRNLREISPTSYSNVPAGYAVLATVMEKDDALARSFFKNLKGLGYGGAALPDDLYERMQRLAVKHTGHRLVFGTGWGSTETAPTATSTYWETDRVGLIGLPFPGVELKLVPAGPKYEIRVRGKLVTPGYYRQPELTRAAFDEEGFYRIGDAARFVDPDGPEQGLVFAGRVVEDFKLLSGTFVHVGGLRLAALSAATPVLQDAVVTGQDREFVGLLAWPNLAACRQLVGKPDATLAEVAAHPAVLTRVKDGLAEHNRANPGSSLRIARVLLLNEPPSIDGSEITDKGYINQRAVLDRRAAEVARLYADPPAAGVIVVV
jgi:feruloyl-CoA synthase